METHSETVVSQRRQHAASQLEDDQDSGLRYTLRSQNFCLLAFLPVSVLTVACACVAIAAAVAEHLWTSLDDTQDISSTSDNSAQVAMQKLSERDIGKTVFCFVDESGLPGLLNLLSANNDVMGLCDAIVYVSVGVHISQKSTRFRNPAADSLAIERLAAMKTMSAAIITWACVGSKSEESPDFSSLIHGERSRLAFIHNSVAWLRRTGLDGLVLYWKYPSRENRLLWNTLIRIMHNIFRTEGLQLTVVLPWNMEKRRGGYFEHSLYLRLEVVLMDTHRTVEASTFPVTTCQSPVRAVFRARHHGQVGLSAVLDDLSMVTAHLLHKTIFSVSLAGVSFTLKRPRLQHRVGMTVIGPGRPLGRVNRSGLVSYYDVASMLHNNTSWASYLHGFSRCAVAHWKDQWIGFEDSNSLRAKRPLLRKSSALAVWDLAMDDFSGLLGPKWPLLRQVNELVHGKISSQRPLRKSTGSSS